MCNKVCAQCSFAQIKVASGDLAVSKSADERDNFCISPGDLEQDLNFFSPLDGDMYYTAR